MSELLRLSEVRTKLGVCKDTILKWIRQGTLPSAVKLNGRHYFVAADIEIWLNNNGKTITKWQKKEQADVEQADVEQAAVEQVAVEQAAVEQAAVEQVAVEHVEQAAVEQVAVEQVAVEQAAVEAVTEDFFCPNNSQGGSND
jgi:predicted DNA-binding transcriptional regulator AlpA